MCEDFTMVNLHCLNKYKFSIFWYNHHDLFQVKLDSNVRRVVCVLYVLGP